MMGVRATVRRLCAEVLLALVALSIVVPAALAHQTSGNRIRIYDGNLVAVDPSYERTPTSDYTTTAGGTHNYYNHPGVTYCPGVGNGYRIRIVRERTLLPDVFFSWKALGCESDANVTWSPTDTGNWHTDMQKESGSDASASWTVEGHMHYPN